MHGGQSYEYPHKLIYCETSFRSQEECEELHAKHHQFIANNFVCTQGASKLSSVKQAGNPLVANNTLYGLSVHQTVDLFINVFAHKKWIQESIVPKKTNTIGSIYSYISKSFANTFNFQF